MKVFLPALLLSLPWFLAARASAQEPTYDLLVRGGTIVDGTGAPRRRADLYVKDGRIAHVGPPGTERAARRTIDATGRIVAPGFVDPHAHGDPTRTPAFENFLAMGVTTICLGLDGSSPDPTRLDAWLAACEEGPLGVDVALLVGHGTVRRAAGCGLREALGDEDLERMSALVDRALDWGALGLSTGLEYDAGRPAGPRELAAVARPVGRRDRVVMSHVRSEDDGELLPAIAELLEQCTASGARAHVSHLKIVHGREVEKAEAVLAFLDRARERALRVTADVYPYTASYTGIGIVYPEWALPPHSFGAARAERREELARFVREKVTRRGGPRATLFGSGKHAGRTLEEVAREFDRTFEDVLIDHFPPGSASAACFVMDEDVMTRLLLDPHVMVSSDGSPTMHHPRGYGAFARFLRRFVVEESRLSLEEAIRKMTSLPAEVLGLDDRGVLAVGKVAHLVVFDPSAVRDRATYTEPHLLAEGFETVIVRGVPTRVGGELVHPLAGQVVRRP